MQHSGYEKFVNKIISYAVFIEDHGLKLTFEDGTQATIRDDAQYCCESRWVTTDDSVEVLIGGRFLSLTEDYAHTCNEDEEDDQMFVKVEASTGFVTLCTHNEHNGYYGGFNVVMN
jgi:hypothetical protein